MSRMTDCCVRGFQWDAVPKGTEMEMASRNCYCTGTNSRVAIMLIHDLGGWKFPNSRILADHLASEVDATVYVPDL